MDGASINRRSQTVAARVVRNARTTVVFREIELGVLRSRLGEPRDPIPPPLRREKGVCGGMSSLLPPILGGVHVVFLIEKALVG